MVSYLVYFLFDFDLDTISNSWNLHVLLTVDTADATLIDSNLNKLLYLVCMGRRVLHVIIQNVTFSLVVKALVFGFTFAGKASLWAAIASDVGAMLLVTLNGMRLLPSSRKMKTNENVAESKGDEGVFQSKPNNQPNHC